MRQIGAWFIIIFFVLSMPVHANATHSIPDQAKKKLNQLSKASSGHLQINWNELTNTPSSILGDLTPPSRQAYEGIALQFLSDYKAIYGLQDIKKQLKIIQIEHKNAELIQIHLQHILYRIPVWQDGLVVTIDQAGVIHHIEGVIHPNMEKSLLYRPLHAAITRTQAVNKAKTWLALEIIAKDTKTTMYYLPQYTRNVLVYAVTFHLVDSDTPVTVLVHSLTGRILEPLH